MYYITSIGGDYTIKECQGVCAVIVTFDAIKNTMVLYIILIIYNNIQYYKYINYTD